jgi:hypothetical protein
VGERLIDFVIGQDRAISEARRVRIRVRFITGERTGGFENIRTRFKICMDLEKTYLLEPDSCWLMVMYWMMSLR